MKINRNFIAVLFLIPLFLVGCINDDLNNVDKDLTNAEIMKQLKIGDVAIWNTLTTQGIDLATLKSSGLKSGQDIKEYPNGEVYYFALFEDLYPSEGDYDFNDIIIKSKLGLEKTGNETSGYFKSELINKGGTLPVEIGLMFYEASANLKSYTRIPNENITVNGVTLLKGAGPWSTPYASLGKSWKIEYKITKNIKIVWIAYYIVTVREGKRTEILTSGFAPTNVTTTFEIPRTEFISKNKLPWGLEIEAKEFAIPNEKELFLNAYPDFKKWVESNGQNFKNWFNNPVPEFTHN